ncbi:MAG: hypothetical protein M0P69_07440 [Bacteroidales bacterium]|nr:hypothetical protein [Bacteroidales bacterium]
MTNEERVWFFEKVCTEESYARMGGGDPARPINKVKLIIQKYLDREFYEAKELAAMLGVTEYYLKSLLENESLNISWGMSQRFESCLGIPSDMIWRWRSEYEVELWEYRKKKG